MKTAHEDLEVEFRIGRPEGMGLLENEQIRIEAYCKRSGVSFIRLEMSHEEFSKALGSRQIECLGTLRGLDRIGMDFEQKKEFVQMPEGLRYMRETSKDREEALKPLEVDGWRARRGDFGNHHLYVQRKEDGGWGYTVSFTRHVDPETGEPIL